MGLVQRKRNVTAEGKCLEVFQLGWSLEHPDLVEIVLAYGRGLELDGLGGPSQHKPLQDSTQTKSLSLW